MSTGVEILLPGKMLQDATPSADAVVSANELTHELAWLDLVLQTRISLHFGQPSAHASIDELGPPDLTGEGSPYAQMVREHAMSSSERLVLMLALAPHLQPALLDILFLCNKTLDRGFTEFGGWKGRAHGGFLPTCETAAFLVASDNLSQRLALLRLFDKSHFFRRRGILRLTHDAPGEPFFSAPLLVGSETLSWITTGVRHKPDYSSSFPAKLITTPLTWSDLVLSHEALEDVAAINTWIRHSGSLLSDWKLDKAIKPGYRCLFFGPPGTGKTLTATLIGQAACADVYRIDLSRVVSKFIVETEKNLAQVFDQAQDRNWILFF